MAEEVGIVMSLYDRVSPTLKSIAGNSKAFDKTLDELEASLKAYDKAQETMVKRSADLKKALAEADQEVRNAQKSYKKFNDEASKNALDQAIDRQTELRRELTETESSLRANAKAYDTLYEKARKAASGVQTVSTEASKAENRAGSGGILSTLGQAGAWSMLGDVASQWSETLVTSAGGSEVGTLFSGALSGAGSGAAIGTMIAPGIGTAVGAGVGALVGLAGGASQVYENRDEAFKEYYQQLYEQGQTKADESLTAGSATASQRELDAIAFNRLLDGQGATYLSDLRTLAADTPLEYSGLTDMSRALATGFGDDTDRMLELITAIGDAGSAVGVDTSGMTYMSQIMSRMESSGKVGLEDLNAFQDRGIDVIGMLSEALDKTQGQIYDMISKGQISGGTAVDIIQAGMQDQFGGAMETMAQTFEGLTSTLEDTMAELDNARGEGYNEERKEGLIAETDAYSGPLGEAVSNMNRLAGQNEAYLENLSDQYTREALSAVLLGEDTSKGLFTEDQVRALEDMRGEFVQASTDYENGSQEAGIKMENLRQQAEALATAAYESSDVYQDVQGAELDLITAIRENTAAYGNAAWMIPYLMGQELSKGQGATLSGSSASNGMLDTWADDGGNVHTSKTKTNGWYDDGGNWHPNAFGLTRVPYDGFPAILHQGERVLTAAEARAEDVARSRQGRETQTPSFSRYLLAPSAAEAQAPPSAGTGRSTTFNITITGNQFGGGVTAEDIAQRLADVIEVKLAAGAVS